MKKALFKTGDKVRYLGNKRAEQGRGFNPVMKPVIFPGMVATITETHKPTKGYGYLMADGELIPDPDEDGYNVYTNEYGESRIIWPDNKKDWKLI